MKYKEEVKDLFSVSEDYYFAHCISADFGMGKGIVVEFNKRFDMKHILQRKYPEYAKHFMDCKISGDCILEGRVLNLITKERYFHKPTLAAMKAALQKMKEICERESIYKIAMPTIGAGLDKGLGQYFAALTNMRSVGVMGDYRTYDYAIVLRAVNTSDFMTAEPAQIPWDVLGKVASRIVNEVKGVNRVLYDCTGKPPATIEFE